MEKLESLSKVCLSVLSCCYVAFCVGKCRKTSV